MISKILTAEIEPLKISSLPTRPTAPTSFGGRGYTAAEMKGAFDRLPLLIIEKFNGLVDAISAVGEDALANSIPSGIADGHTLGELLADIKNGSFASYLDVYGKTLTERLESILGDITRIKRDMGDGYSGIEYITLDCGGPKQRMEEAANAE